MVFHSQRVDTHIFKKLGTCWHGWLSSGLKTNIDKGLAVSVDIEVSIRKGFAHEFNVSIIVFVMEK